MYKLHTVSGPSPHQVAEEANALFLSKPGFTVLGAVQGFIEPDGRAYFWISVLEETV